MTHSCIHSILGYATIDKSPRIGKTLATKKVKTNTIIFDDDSTIECENITEIKKTKKGFILRYPDGEYLEYEFCDNSILSIQELRLRIEELQHKIFAGSFYTPEDRQQLHGLCGELWVRNG